MDSVVDGLEREPCRTCLRPGVLAKQLAREAIESTEAHTQEEADAIQLFQQKLTAELGHTCCMTATEND
jgi:hypothetical protein